MFKILFTSSLLFVCTFFSAVVLAGEEPAQPNAESNCLTKPKTPAGEPCETRAKNFLEGRTLFVEGQTDRSIYDILVMDPQINRIEFNSYGGPVFLGEEVARLIRERQITTSVRDGARCASLCALTYQAGVKREAHINSWFGFHGQQFLSLQQEYEVKCVEISKKTKREREQLCLDFKKMWAEECRKRTDVYHGLIELYGATPALYEDFKKRDPDPEWEESGNCATVMPWQMSAMEAVRYNIVLDLKK